MILWLVKGGEGKHQVLLGMTLIIMLTVWNGTHTPKGHALDNLSPAC